MTRHIDFTIKAPREATPTTASLPHEWMGRAAGAIKALADDPHALDGVGEIDMDAVHRKLEDDA